MWLPLANKGTQMNLVHVCMYNMYFRDPLKTKPKIKLTKLNLLKFEFAFA